ncbi:CwfJ C-terminus 2-domain-containing protein-like protein [Aspergillus bertholletiae]|uniref:CwfJ C-terminus 2-domain-containing protein-like protein n=1 Tax=Aspergillus bertholletiae TaxID=1226010 RepID=A0A5N7ATA6_9EURO|nr:CwfJ C-terminus 2-domain-containing protein-like protein [Aspergillus bertholletiae]
MASKIIVIGGVNCQLREVFTKLAKLHVKQSFSFAIIVGDLFGDCSTEQELDEISALFEGSISVPLPTYFALGSRPLPTRVVEKIEANDEVCPNLYFLGKRGTLKTSEGIRLVALGGNLETESKSTDKNHPGYTESDARALYGAHSADILITHQWPKGIRTRSQVPIPEEATKPEEVQCIADLCATLKPRYHLSATEFFYEREPFFHLPPEDNPDAKPLTRFISVASYGNSSKQKWMYAFTLDPKAPYPLTIPPGTTASPLAPVQTKRKPLSSQKESYSRFAVDDEGNRPRKRARGPPPGPDQCFFCLSNPNIATHLITSIGNEAYLTTAKGPLPTSKTFPALGFPGHMLIIPFTHTPTLSSIPDQESRLSTYTEMQRYRQALHAMLKSKTNNDDNNDAAPLGAVTWEVSRGNGIHTHWQFLPVPASLVARGLVTAAFKVEAENLKYPKFESPSSSSDPSAEPGDFFRVWIWGPDQDAPSGETEKTLLLQLGPEFRFDLQFGRRVMAKLMELEGRINWKNDVQSQEEEETDATAFKDAFKGFDFTLEE